MFLFFDGFFLGILYILAMSLTENEDNQHLSKIS